MLEDVIVGNVYIHVKSGNAYQVMNLAQMENDLSHVVVYQPFPYNDLYPTWVRPLGEFKEKFIETLGG